MKVYLYRLDWKTNEFQTYEGDVRYTSYEGYFTPKGERWAKYTVSRGPGEVKGGNVWFFEPNEKRAVALLKEYFEKKVETNARALERMQKRVAELMLLQNSMQG